MNTDQKNQNLICVHLFSSVVDSFFVRACAFIVFPMVAGCGTPSAANIELRKQNQTLQAQVDQLTDQHHRDVETLAATERARPTTPQLPPERLARLTTTHGLNFGRLTGGDNPDSTQQADTQLKVVVVPVDEEGIPIKAAGTFKIDAYDLDEPGKPLLGTWNFDLDQTRDSFYSRFALYTYVLECPYQRKPVHQNVTIHVTFEDALTGRAVCRPSPRNSQVAGKPTLRIIGKQLYADHPDC